MRSMRARRSSAVASGCTVNGSTGARRKRDFVFMPRLFCHNGKILRLLPSKGVADPAEERGRAADADGIADPRRAGGHRHRDVVKQDEIHRQLAADGRADVSRAKCGVPGTPRVEKARGVDRTEKYRP